MIYMLPVTFSLAALAAAQSTPNYFFAFGDSYSQTGFDINGSKPSPANPIGNPNYPGYTTSGGANWIDLLTEEFNSSLTLTYNFAYGGATVDASLVAPYQPTVLSLIDQVGEFNKSVASHPSYAPWTDKNTVVGIWMGVNDVGNSFYEADETNRIAAIMERYFEQLEIIYKAGARKFILLSVPPTNRTPVMMQNDANSQALLVSAIEQFNAGISSIVSKFQAAHSCVRVKVVDTSRAFNEALDNPAKYGAPDNTCYNGDGVSCLWWNNYHPGIAIQTLVAAEVAAVSDSDFFTCHGSTMCTM